MKVSIPQFMKVLNRFPGEFNEAANRAMVDAAKKSVPVVKKELRNAETSEGSFPLIASRDLYNSTKSKIISTRRRGIRRVSEVGVYESYAAAMEYGTAPHTPPMGPLIKWARYKRAILQRKRTVGRARGSKLVSREKDSPGAGGQKRKRGPGVANRADRMMAYFVQQKIKRKGIKPRFFMAKSMSGIEKKVVTGFRKHSKGLSKKFPVRIRVRRVS